MNKKPTSTTKTIITATIILTLFLATGLSWQGFIEPEQGEALETGEINAKVQEHPEADVYRWEIVNEPSWEMGGKNHAYEVNSPGRYTLKVTAEKFEPIKPPSPPTPPQPKTSNIQPEELEPIETDTVTINVESDQEIYFEITEVNSQDTYLGEEAVTEVLITNTGEAPGVQDIDLKVYDDPFYPGYDPIFNDTKHDVEIGAGETKTIEFSERIPQNKEYIGDYISVVSSDDDHGRDTFEVKEGPIKLVELRIKSTEGGNVTEPGEGKFGYTQGREIDLLAEPDPGYEFKSWIGDTEDIGDPTSPNTTITMNNNYCIEAVFREEKYELTINSSEGGQVTNPGEGTYKYTKGEEITLNTTEETGYRFLNWTGDTETIDNVNNSQTTITINDDHDITANFGVAISDWYDLNDIRKDLSGDYILLNNLNESTPGYNDLVDTKNGWKPIGNTTNKFNGTFDGQNYVISDLYINRPITDSIGLFGYIKDARIRGVGLENADITGKSEVGGLAGYIFPSIAGQTTISDSYVTGTVKGGSHTGGLIGYIRRTHISNSYMEGKVAGKGVAVGGLIGGSYVESNVSKSYTDVSVEGESDYVGGLIGGNWFSTSSVHDSYATGRVRGTNDVGGLIGYNEGKIISNSYATAETMGNKSIGGLVGYSTGEIYNSYSTGSVNGNESTGGLIGGSWNINVSNSYYNTNTSGQNDTGKGEPKNTSEMIWRYSHNTYENWDFEEKWVNGTHRIVSDHKGNTGYPALEWQKIEGFKVTITTPEDNDEFIKGREVTVKYNITNIGNVQDTQNISLAIEKRGNVREKEEVTLKPNETYEGTFTWTANEVGTHKIIVSSEDHRDTVEILVKDTGSGGGGGYTPRPEHELIINLDGEGSTDPEEGTHMYYEGEEVIITADPADGWYFEEWTGDYEGVEEEITITMDEDKEITAHFTEEDVDKYKLTVNTIGQGSVNINPDQEEYEYGTEVEITAIADEGWEFVEWTGDYEGVEEEITITMDEDKQITANFTEKPEEPVEEEEEEEEEDIMTTITGMVIGAFTHPGQGLVILIILITLALAYRKREYLKQQIKIQPEKE